MGLSWGGSGSLWSWCFGVRLLSGGAGLLYGWGLPPPGGAGTLGLCTARWGSVFCPWGWLLCLWFRFRRLRCVARSWMWMGCVVWRGASRAPRCPYLVGVLRLVEVSRDAAGSLCRAVPFLASRRLLSGVGSGRACRWLAWSLSLRLEGASGPVVSLSGSCDPDLVKRAVLQSVESSLGVDLSGVRDVAAVRVVSPEDPVTAVCGTARGLLKDVFFMDPSHLSGVDLADLESASLDALHDLGVPAPVPQVVAYTDGSYPHGKDHGPSGAAVVTADGQWAARAVPPNLDTAFDCEADAMVLALEVTPLNVPLLLRSDCKSLVSLLNDVVASPAVAAQRFRPGQAGVRSGGPHRLRSCRVGERPQRHRPERSSRSPGEAHVPSR